MPFCARITTASSRWNISATHWSVSILRFSSRLPVRKRRREPSTTRNWKTYRDNLHFEQGNITLPGEKELVDELTTLTERYQQQGTAFYARAADDPRRNADYFADGGLLETFTRIKSVAGQIARINQDHMEEASRDAHRTAVRSLVGFAVGMVLCIALGGFGIWYIFHTVLSPIRAVTKSAEGISTGNFDQIVPYLSGDTLGQLAAAFNQ